MLIGTFQKFPHDEDGKYCNPIDVKRKFYPELGFAPVWGFPIESVEDFFAQSICIFPNFPEILYVVDVDNYLKLDKVRWHKDRKEKTVGNIKDYIDPNLPNERSEFLLNPSDIFGPGNQIKVIVNIAAIKSFIDGNCDLKTVMLEVDCFSDDVVPYIRKRMDEAWNSLSTPKVANKEAFTKAELESKILSCKCKQVFTAVLLPFVYFFATGQAAYPFMTEMCSANLMQMNRLHGEIADWVLNDCSEGLYLEIYNKIRELPIEDYRVLATLAENKSIGRNDKCPCESGKKWKKCHGRLIIR